MKKTLKSCAKINLGLKIRGKREDGFHEIETIMHEIDLHDTIEVEPAEKTSLKVEGCNLEAGEDNLLLKAYRMLQREFPGKIQEYKITLTKRIPLGSGMGGGSSNAISLLSYIAECDLANDIRVQKQDEWAAALGSDTNFFLKGGTALCRGRGEKVEQCADNTFYFNLIIPPFSCFTPKVFSHYVARPWPRNWTGFESSARIAEPVNDLKSPCFMAYPELKELYESLKSSECSLYLSGSGSTLFTFHTSCVERDSYSDLLRESVTQKGASLIRAESYFRS